MTLTALHVQPKGSATRRQAPVPCRAHQADGRARRRRARRGIPCRGNPTTCIDDPTRRCCGRRVAGVRSSPGSMPHAGTRRARPLHATAPAAPAARTTTRPSRGRDPQPARVAATSPASARADASSHPRTGERWRWASSVPRPRATSRAPRARVKVLVDARPASVPTQGREGSVGAAKATTPRAVRTHASTCTAWSLRRSESANTPSSYWVRIPNRGSRTVLLSTWRTTMRDRLSGWIEAKYASSNVFAPGRGRGDRRATTRISAARR